VTPGKKTTSRQGTGVERGGGGGGGGVLEVAQVSAVALEVKALTEGAISTVSGGEVVPVLILVLFIK
jgi:hypothetical protein